MSELFLIQGLSHCFCLLVEYSYIYRNLHDFYYLYSSLEARMKLKQSVREHIMALVLLVCT